jgi:hypothetical protein
VSEYEKNPIDVFFTVDGRAYLAMATDCVQYREDGCVIRTLKIPPGATDVTIGIGRPPNGDDDGGKP